MKVNEIKIIFISIFLLVFIWIAFNIYHNSITSTIPEAMSTKINPIDPNFDTKVIEKVKNRIRVTPIFDFQKNISPEETPKTAETTPSPTPTVASLSSSESSNLSIGTRGTGLEQ